MAIRPYIRGLFVCVMLFLSSFLGVLIMGGVVFPLFFINPVLYRKMYDKFLGWWEYFAAALLEILSGVKVVITGDAIRPGERNLIMMNHRTRLDWMFFWSALVRESGVCTEKIILKSPLKKIPGAGWAMQIGMFMFINRKWDEDKIVLSKLIDYFCDIKYKTQVLLFPEGTDLTERTKAKSDEFAKKNGVQPYEYVLHPRTTGFTYLAQYMRQKSHLDAVYDITIGYPVNIPQAEVDMAKGNFPKEVHFHIKRHAVQSLPITEEGLQEWCKTRWAEKEKRLKSFYEQRKFIEIPAKAMEYGDIPQEGDNPINEIETLKMNEKNQRKVRIIKAGKILKFALVYWIIFVIVIMWLMLHSAIIRYYGLFQIIFFVFMGHKYGGFELFQVDYFNRFFNSKKSQKKQE